MSPEANETAARLNLQVIGPSPWVVRHPRLAHELRGADVNALVARAAAEIAA